MNDYVFIVVFVLILVIDKVLDWKEKNQRIKELEKEVEKSQISIKEHSKLTFHLTYGQIAEMFNVYLDQNGNLVTPTKFPEIFPKYVKNEMKLHLELKKELSTINIEK